MKNWDCLEDAFLQLNTRCEYLVLRNFEGFFDDILLEGHNDIDVLCAGRRDRKIMIHILDAEPRIGVDNGIHYKFLYREKEIDLDIRTLGDGYYDWVWQREMLNKRMYHPAGFYTMDEENYFYSLIYHAIYQKKLLSQEYLLRLRKMNPAMQNAEQMDFEKALLKFMLKNQYWYTIPYDRYVIPYFNKKLVGPYIRYPFMVRVRHNSEKVMEYIAGKMRIVQSIRNRTYEFLYKCLLLPKNIYFNFRVLPAGQAVKLPFFINYGVKIKEVHKGVIELKSDRISRSMISIGRGGSEGIAVTDKGMISFRAKAKIVFEGTAQFHAGTRLWFDDNARAVFGDGFSANRNFLLYYNDKIRFGKDCMLGWNIRIIDGNAHKVIYEGKERDSKCRIVIGDHVWIGAEVQICRSVSIGDHSIVAYGSTVTGGDFPAHSMLGGYPAKIIKEGVNWRK